MPNANTLFRPTGIHEMALIIRSGLREFPPRLERQPIFYPVLTFEYAVQIARDWNARDSSGHAAFVTQFEVDTDYAARFEEHIVGSASVHRELWVPAEQLAEFNQHIVGIIRPVKAFYGEGYEGLPPRTSLANADPPGQLLRLVSAQSDNEVDFLFTIEANWDIVLLNFAWWAEHDFTAEGLPTDHRDRVLRDVLSSWRLVRGHDPVPDCDPVGADLLVS